MEFNCDFAISYVGFLFSSDLAFESVQSPARQAEEEDSESANSDSDNDSDDESMDLEETSNLTYKRFPWEKVAQQ